MNLEGRLGLSGGVGLLGGGGLGGSGGLEVALNLFGVAVLFGEAKLSVRGLGRHIVATHEEHVDHDGPGLGARDGSTDAEDLTAQQPPNETDRVLRLVVARDGNVDVRQRRVGVAQGDDGDVDVRGLTNGLVVDTGVGDDDQTGLLERAGRDRVGEGTGNETSSDGLSTGVGSELEDGTLSVGAGRDNADLWGKRVIRLCT